MTIILCEIENYNLNYSTTDVYNIILDFVESLIKNYTDYIITTVIIVQIS